MKFHVQLECTVDIVVEATDRASLAQAVANLTDADADDLARETHSGWERFISSAIGPAPAKWNVTNGRITKGVGNDAPDAE